MYTLERERRNESFYLNILSCSSLSSSAKHLSWFISNNQLYHLASLQIFVSWLSSFFPISFWYIFCGMNSVVKDLICKRFSHSFRRTTSFLPCVPTKSRVFTWLYLVGCPSLSLDTRKVLEGRCRGYLSLLNSRVWKTALKYTLWENKYWESFWPAMSFGIWRATGDGTAQSDILWDFLP